VALVAAAGLAVTADRPDRPPSTDVLPSASMPAVPPCGESDVTGTVALKPGGPDLAGQLDLTSRVPGGCRLDGPPRLALLGDDLSDLGVETRWLGDESGRTVPATGPLLVEMRWYGPFCAPRQRALVLRVEFGGTGFRLPLDPAVTPLCSEQPDRAGLEARWLPPVPQPCGTEAYDLVSVEAVEAGDDGVRFVAVLVNVSRAWCDIDVRPRLTVVAGDGRPLDLGHVATSDTRRRDGLPPGYRVRATVTWRVFCGPPPGDYEATLRFGSGGIVLPLDRHPVPRCVSGGSGQEGVVMPDWLEPVDVAVRR
jgi:hypothetical protein